MMGTRSWFKQEEAPLFGIFETDIVKASELANGRRLGRNGAPAADGAAMFEFDVEADAPAHAIDDFAAGRDVVDGGFVGVMRFPIRNEFARNDEAELADGTALFTQQNPGRITEEEIEAVPSRTSFADVPEKVVDVANLEIRRISFLVRGSFWFSAFGRGRAAWRCEFTRASEFGVERGL